MKINVNEIPEQGLQFTEAYDPKEWDIETPDIKFRSKVEAVGSVTRFRDEVRTVVDVKATMEEECARCLAKFEVPLSRRLNFTYNAREQSVIDITNDVRQEIILGYPLKPLCREDCKGFCQVCGQNLNERECSCDRTFKDWDKGA